MKWVQTRDLYAYWPALATLDTVDDERLRGYIDAAEESVAGELRGLGFDPERAHPGTLKRLVIFRALADILAYPHGDRGVPGNVGRASEYFYARYLDELRRVVNKPQILGGLDPRSSAVPRAFPTKPDP